MSTLKLVLGFLGCALLLKIVYSLVRQKWLHRVMPPGPPGLPLLGHILRLQPFQWLQFTEWANQYGPIFSLNFAGQPVVVINNATVAIDLLDRRSNVYSDRPPFTMINRILTQGLILPTTRYGDRWRRIRRAAHVGFNKSNSRSYEAVMSKESTLLMSRLLRTAENWESTVRRSVGAMVLGVVYDWPLQDSRTDSLIHRIDEFMSHVAKAGLPGSFLVDIFPWMLYLPESVARWKREGLQRFRMDTEMFEGLQETVRDRMNTGRSESCFVAKLLMEQEKFNLDDRETAWTAGMMFGAAVDTTATTIAAFMLAMVHYPDAMRRAQVEIDAVVGTERMPTLDDRPKLPYIEAIVKEINRWRPAAPLAAPRYTMHDDVYEGYQIPKGTVVLLNVWAINHDTTYFPDHDTFRPERYFNASGELIDIVPNARGYGNLTFGTGRRICVGKDFATQALFLLIARILWAFNIGKATDENGCPIVPSTTDSIDEGLVVRPALFPCTITPRSDKVANIISREAECMQQGAERLGSHHAGRE